MTRTTKLISAAAVAVVIAGGGIGYAAAQSGDDALQGGDLDRATAAALEAVGEGTVTGAERDDGGYDVDVVRADGTEVDVDLDANFGVIRTDDDRADVDVDDDRDDVDVDGRDADDRALTDAEREQASAAALAATGEGTVRDVDADDDGGYDVEVVLADGTEVDVDLDAAFVVLRTEIDR